MNPPRYPTYALSTSISYINDLPTNDDTITVTHDDSIPPPPTLSLGCSVRYKHDDHVEVGKLVGVDCSKPSDPTLYDVEFKDGRKVQTTREHIELEFTSDVFALPTQTRTMLEAASTLSKEDLDALINPSVLTPLQQLWLWWHEVLDHLPRAAMNRLVDRG